MVRLCVLALCLALTAACTRNEPEGFREERSTENVLPDGFPRDLPLPDPRTVVHSATSAHGVVVYLTTSDPDDEVVADIRARLPRSGWTIRSCLRTPATPEPVVTIVADKAGKAASYSVGFSPAFAEAIGGIRYDLFVSVAFDASPAGSPLPCDL